MDRRDFLTVCAASGFLSVAPTQLTATSDASKISIGPLEIFPHPPPPKHLFVTSLKDRSLSERHLFCSLQGLINRNGPQIYYVGDTNDEMWLAYYGEQYGITHERVVDPESLLERFAGEIEGYILYDPNLPDTRNVATLLGGLTDCLPVDPSLAEKLDSVGLRKSDDLRGRWKDRYEAYRWALSELLPKGNRHLLGTNCVDEPHWPCDSLWVDDYFIAHNLFVSDLSACRRDREDRKLLDEIYVVIEKPGCLIGWRSARNTEHEMVGFAARRGISMLCALHTLNMTVHTAIPKSTEPFQQTHLTEEEAGPVEKKIYISFMNTDGDSLYSMLRLQSGRFQDPEHGRIPYTWAFLPLAYDLMPGVARYNYELKRENDYFAASTCGVLYTYPHLLPDTREYLRHTRYYMEKTGLRTAYMSNWDDDFWWQDMETPGFYEKLCEELPDSIGFVRGMGESPFEPHLFGACAPYVFCGEGIHSDSDVYTTLNDFIEANPIRPLFIYCLVNHSTHLGRILEAVERLPKEGVEYVRLDAFFHLLNQARRADLIGEELYPDKSGVQKILAREALAAWPKKRDSILRNAERANLSEMDFSAGVEDPLTRLVLDRSKTPVSDVVGFDAVWDSMHLVRLALNAKRINVNNKKKGVQDFIATFGEIPDVKVVEELWRVWEKWEETPVSYPEGCSFAKRLGVLAQQVDATLQLSADADR